MIQKLTHLLEDPKYPSVGPHLRLLGLGGLWHPNLNTITKFKQVLYYLIIAYFFSQYTKCVIQFNIESFKLLLQYAPFHIGMVKAISFKIDYKSWEKVINYMSSLELEQLSKKDMKLDNIISKYISQNRRLTYFYWTLATCNTVGIFTEPYQKNQLNQNGTSSYFIIFDAYPFDKEPPGYYVSMMVQTTVGIVLGIYLIGWDTLVICLMTAFACQLKIARLHCARIVENNNDIQSKYKNIAEFHRYYTTLIRYQMKLSSMISPVMFLYLIVVSVNIGVLIIQIIELQDDPRALLSCCVYLFGVFVQLLIYYWHSNEIIIESLEVSYGVFESDWLEGDKRLRKEIALLSVTTTKRLVFRAGPFSEMSLSTFVAILRGSYSFYALLNRTNQENF